MKLLLPALLLLAFFIACDETTEPDCQTQECLAAADGGVPPDGAPPPPPSIDDAGITPPLPFDAGTPPAPTCKGLFELCSGFECCSPNACTNGTCR